MKLKKSDGFLMKRDKLDNRPVLVHQLWVITLLTFAELLEALYCPVPKELKY